MTESGSYPEQLDELARTFAAAERPAGGVPTGAHHGHPGHHAPSVRAFEYRGHQVQIATRYEVTVDGERWHPPLQVHQDGSVTYHGLPQRSRRSRATATSGCRTGNWAADGELDQAAQAGAPV